LVQITTAGQTTAFPTPNSAVGLAGIAFANITGLLLLPIVLPAAIPTYAPLITPLAVNTIGAVLALVFLRHRDQIERDRQWRG
jgi:hypothetical protein